LHDQAASQWRLSFLCRRRLFAGEKQSWKQIPETGRQECTPREGKQASFTKASSLRKIDSDCHG